MANKVRIRALRPFFGVYGKVKPGDEVEVSEGHAKRYIDRGIAIPANFKGEKAPLNKMEGSPANKAAANPSKTSRDGSRTGEEKRSSSSRAGRASKSKTSTKSKEERE